MRPLENKPQVLSIAIETGRGLAALAVVGFHLAAYIASAVPQLGGIAAAGHFGVPVFFVISGYCMLAVCRQTIRRGESASTFLYWRFLRIFPPFWFSILAVMLVPELLAVLGAAKTGEINIQPAKWMEFSPHEWISHVTLLQVFEARNVGMDRAFSGLNTVYWTLAIEFQFYLVMTLALLMRDRFNLVILFVTSLGAVAAAFPYAYQTGLFFPYWPMFALGLMLHAALASGWTPDRLFGRRSFPLATSLLVAVAVADLAFVSSRFGAHFHRESGNLSNFLQATVAALCLWAAIPLDQRLAAFARKSAVGRGLIAPFLLLGTVSYSLYLLHAKLYQIPFAFVRQLLPSDNALSPLLTVAGTVALTYAFYLWFERPFLRRHRAGVALSAKAKAAGESA